MEYSLISFAFYLHASYVIFLIFKRDTPSVGLDAEL
jgi:hypothetical protein